MCSHTSADAHEADAQMRTKQLAKGAHGQRTTLGLICTVLCGSASQYALASQLLRQTPHTWH